MLTKEPLELEHLDQKEARAAIEVRTPDKRLAAVKENGTPVSAGRNETVAIVYREAALRLPVFCQWCRTIDIAFAW
jgi:hypothetical protein